MGGLQRNQLRAFRSSLDRLRAYRPGCVGKSQPASHRTSPYAVQPSLRFLNHQRLNPPEEPCSSGIFVSQQIGVRLKRNKLKRGCHPEEVAAATDEGPALRQL